MSPGTPGGLSVMVGRRSGPEHGRPLRDEDGSLIVEMVIIMPVLFVLVLILVVFGRVSEAHQQVVEAARAGAEAAAVLPTSESAQSGGPEAAAIGVFGQTHTCVHAQITTDLGQFPSRGFRQRDRGMPGGPVRPVHTRRPGQHHGAGHSGGPDRSLPVGVELRSLSSPPSTDQDASISAFVDPLHAGGLCLDGPGRRWWLRAQCPASGL